MKIWDSVYRSITDIKKYSTLYLVGFNYLEPNLFIFKENSYLLWCLCEFCKNKFYIFCVLQILSLKYSISCLHLRRRKRKQVCLGHSVQMKSHSTVIKILVINCPNNIRNYNIIILHIFFCLGNHLRLRHARREWKVGIGGVMSPYPLYHRARLISNPIQ